MQKKISIITVFLVLLLFASCNSTKFVGNDELLLTHNSITSSTPGIEVESLSQYLRQQPNTKWFSALNVPLGIYSLSGADTTKAVNLKLREWGEAPVILDSAKTQASLNSLRTAMQNRGFLDAQVSVATITKGKRAKVAYSIAPGRQYTVRNVVCNIADARIDSLHAVYDSMGRGIKPGSPFSVNALQEERKSLTVWLNDMGYMNFNKENITFLVDSCKSGEFVDITMNIGLFRRSSSEPFTSHPYYTIGNVTYVSPANQGEKLRRRVLDINTLLRSGDTYRASNVQKTYNKFSRLQAVRSTSINFKENAGLLGGTAPTVPIPLDAEIHITRKKPHSIRIEPEGTNTSGDFGAALSLTYENRNVFHGSEVFSLQARTAFEAIKGLEGYQNSDYEEYGIEGRLAFPEFILPGVTRTFLRRHNATSEFIASYNRQNRPEFHRRVFNAGWRYRWGNSTGSRLGYTFDLIDVDYVSMPWISETFKRDYLDTDNTRNAILRYNYENILILKTAFGITYTDHANSLKTSIETAGNSLEALTAAFHATRDQQGHHKFAGVAFAQYVKADADYTHLVRIDSRNSLALHARIGIALPYGNSTMLPFEKRYFSGGANSVRGWSVRQLGPGRYRGTDGRIDFINQTGDMRLDLNAELRTDLFWKLQGALFIDAGNIWTVRRYDDQPQGEFTLQGVYRDMAVAYGAGLRLNFDYFILRLDLGMKAVNPVHSNTREHFPALHPNFARDRALHFAVGMPF